MTHEQESRLAELRNAYSAASGYYGSSMAAFERGEITRKELGQSRAAMTRAATAVENFRYACISA